MGAQDGYVTVDDHRLSRGSRHSTKGRRHMPFGTPILAKSEMLGGTLASRHKGSELITAYRTPSCGSITPGAPYSLPSAGIKDPLTRPAFGVPRCHRTAGVWRERRGFPRRVQTPHAGGCGVPRVTLWPDSHCSELGFPPWQPAVVSLWLRVLL
jgi:hypothetical protein